jgi:hypothetical protein
MALVTTTLLAPIASNVLRNIAVGNAALFQPGIPVKIDNEYMVCVSTNVVANTITVRARGNEGTMAEPHDINAIVVTSTVGPSDFPLIPPAGNSLIDPPAADDLVTIGATGETIAVPTRNTTYVIAATSAAAITLVSGTPAQTGIQLEFVSQGAYAHTITYAAGFTTPTGTLATFTAKAGSSLLVEVGPLGVLYVVAANNVTITL